MGSAPHRCGHSETLSPAIHLDSFCRGFDSTSMNGPMPCRHEWAKPGTCWASPENSTVRPRWYPLTAMAKIAAWRAWCWLSAMVRPTDPHVGVSGCRYDRRRPDVTLVMNAPGSEPFVSVPTACIPTPSSTRPLRPGRLDNPDRRPDSIVYADGERIGPLTSHRYGSSLRPGGAGRPPRLGWRLCLERLPPIAMQRSATLIGTTD